MPGSLRVALVGCGKVADSHVNAILGLPDTRLVGVCDCELLMAEQLAMRFGRIPMFDDMDALIKRERPDVVHITTPPQTHLALARRAFEAGCHVFLEKPATLNTHEVIQLLNAATAARKLVTINYHYLFDHAALRLRELISQGYIGDVIHIESMYGYDLKGSYGSAVLKNKEHWVHGLPGKLLHNVIDHLINKIVDLAPEKELERICSWGSSRSEESKADASSELYDELRVFLDFGNVTAYATFSSNIRPIGHFVRVYGTKRSATLDLVSSTLIFDPAPALPSALGRLTPPFQSGWRTLSAGLRNVNRFLKSEFQFNYGMSVLLRRFYASIQSGADPPLTYHHLLQVSSIMEQIFAQLREAHESSGNGGWGISRLRTRTATVAAES